MNILFCSAGRRAELLKNFRKSLSPGSRIIATDMSPYAPAIYFSDKHYFVPAISDPTYVNQIVEICRIEKINAITTLIDPEIEILAKNREKFERMGVMVLAPDVETASICFNKYELFQHLKRFGIAVVNTYSSFDEAKSAIENNSLSFPVFVKPRNGSGSVGARKIETIGDLNDACTADPSLIVQEFMDCPDIDVDIYIDAITHEPVSIFTKRKLETKIGGASKTVSFKDKAAIQFICETLKHFKFNGPIDMDLFCRDGQYYLSEINPRFGGAYLHAYGAGVDFVKLIENNVAGLKNTPYFENYEENTVMMMYDSVVVKRFEI